MAQRATRVRCPFTFVSIIVQALYQTVSEHKLKLPLAGRQNITGMLQAIAALAPHATSAGKKTDICFIGAQDSACFDWLLTPSGPTKISRFDRPVMMIAPAIIIPFFLIGADESACFDSAIVTPPVPTKISSFDWLAGLTFTIDRTPLANKHGQTRSAETGASCRQQPSTTQATHVTTHSLHLRREHAHDISS